MDIKKAKYGIPLIIGVLLGIFTSFLPISSFAHVGIIVGIVVGLVSFVYLGSIYRLKFLLFLLFLTFGWMNVPIKPFDVLFVLIAVLFFIMKPNKLNYMRDMRFINYPILAFICISLLSVIVSTNLSIGISYFIHTLFMLLIFFFITILNRTESEFRAIIWGYTFSALISSLVVIAELSGLVVNMGTLFQGVRAQGFFIDPNDFSPFLILSILFLFEKAFKYHYFSKKYYLFLILALVILAALLASLSRAAILNVVIVLFIYLFCSVLYKKLYGHTIVFLLIITILCIFSFILFGDSILNQLSLRFSNSTDNMLQSYDSDRFYFQLKGLILGSTHLLGIGPGQFEILYGYATHNLYVRIIAENGWIAFLFFLTVLIYVLFQLYYYRKNEIWNLPIYLFLAVYVGVLINSLFLDTLHWRYFWFLLGLCCVVLNQVRRKIKGH